MQCPNPRPIMVEINANLGTSIRPMGGSTIPAPSPVQGETVKYWQKGWVPIASRANDVRTLPCQYGSTVYAKYNTLHNSEYQSGFIGVSGKEFMFPSPMYYQGLYSYQNPVADVNPGPLMG